MSAGDNRVNAVARHAFPAVEDGEALSLWRISASGSLATIRLDQRKWASVGPARCDTPPPRSREGHQLAKSRATLRFSRNSARRAAVMFTRIGQPPGSPTTPARPTCSSTNGRFLLRHGDETPVRRA
jgi:hypothetical protein